MEVVVHVDLGIGKLLLWLGLETRESVVLEVVVL